MKYASASAAGGGSSVFSMGRRWVRMAGWCALAVGGLWLGQCGQEARAGVRLTDGTQHGGAFARFCQISPDGTRVVFSADTPDGQTAALYSVPIGGGAVTQIHGGTVLEENYLIRPGLGHFWMYGKRLFEITPDGQSVVYSAEPSTGVVDLYRAPIAGGSSIHLASLSGDDVISFGFYVSPDSGRAVFHMDPTSLSGTPGTTTVYSVPTAGGQSAVTLYEVGSSVSVGSVNGRFPPISPDSSRVIFANGGTLSVTGIDGGAVTALATLGTTFVGNCEFTPDGSHILFSTSSPPITDYTTSTTHSVGVAGGPVVELLSIGSGPGPAPKGVWDGRVATIGSAAIITAHTDAGVTEFRRVAIADGASTVMGTVPADTERVLYQRAVLHDASGAVYQGLDDSQASSLWYIPFAGGTPLRLTDDVAKADSYPELVSPLAASCLLTPDDQIAVYTSATADGYELYSVALAGGASVRLDHGPAAGTYLYDFDLTPDGQYAIYTVCDPPGMTIPSTFHLRGIYAVDVHGGPAWRVNHLLDEGQYIGGYEVAPDGTVVYWAGSDEAGYELYSQPIPEPATLCLLAPAVLGLLARRRRTGSTVRAAST